MQPFFKHLMRKLLAGAVLVASVSNNAGAQDLNAKLPTDPKIIKGKFANGLTYYIRPNSKPEKKVELRLMVNAGAILEDDDQQGLAHFMEHMNFNGTKNFQKNDLVSYLQSIGVAFGADLNAYTGFDETVYILPIPTDKPENLDKGFQIIEDWAHNALLTDKDIDGERAVVLEESRLGKGADDRMMKKYLPVYLNGSRYKDRLPIGKDEILKNFKYDVVRRFYKDWYRPDLQAVAIVGDIDEATAMKYLKKHFEGLKGLPKERERKLYEVPARAKADAMVLTDKEATNYALQILYPSAKKHEEVTLGDYKENMERNMVVSMMNRRLAELSRGSNPPFPYAYVNFEGWARGYESFSAQAGFGAPGVDNALTALTAELVRAKNFGFTATELDLSKKEMMSFIEKAYNERDKTESGRLIDEYVRNFLENEPIPGIENEFSYAKTMLPAISVETLNAKVKEWFASTSTFSLITGPDQGAVKLPSNAELITMVSKGLSQEVKPREERKVSSQLLSSIPKAGKVVSKEEDKELKTTIYTLSNGIKVTVKSTDFKSDEILIRGIKKGGSNNYGVADKFNVQYGAGVVGGMGFGDFTPTDLDKAIVGKTMRVGAGIADINDIVNGSSSVKDFESMLQLMYLKLTSPRLDKDLFNAYKVKQKMQMQFAFSDPQTSFIDTMYRTMFGNQPLAPVAVPRPEFFDQINPERVVEIYKNELSYADGYQFFIVGNIKEDAIPLIETYIGGLPSKGVAPSFKDNGVRAIKGVNTLDFKKGKEKKSLILAMYRGETPYSEELELKATMLAEVMNIKVIEVLREKMGGTYSGGFGANVARDPYPRYVVQLYIPCGPENVDKLVKAANGIIEEIKKNGPSREDLEKVKTTIHEQIREQEKENSYWVENLQEIFFWNKEKNNFLNYEAMVNKLTVDDIKATANQLFDGKNQFTAILNPES